MNIVIYLGPRTGTLVWCYLENGSPCVGEVLFCMLELADHLHDTARYDVTIFVVRGYRIK